MARLVALVAVLTLLVGGTGAARAADSSGPGSRTPSSAKITSAAGLEQSILLAVNEQRRLRGLVPLRLSRGLAAVAREHSVSMAEHGFFDHASYDGSSFWQRIRDL